MMNKKIPPACDGLAQFQMMKPDRDESSTKRERIRLIEITSPVKRKPRD
jgi:hypothetical protein